MRRAFQRGAISPTTIDSQQESDPVDPTPKSRGVSRLAPLPLPEPARRLRSAAKTAKGRVSSRHH